MNMNTSAYDPDRGLCAYPQRYVMTDCTPDGTPMESLAQRTPTPAEKAAAARRQMEEAALTLARLESVPDPAALPDESVISWTYAAHGREWSYVALKAGGNWYPTGRHNAPWSDAKMHEKLTGPNTSNVNIVTAWAAFDDTYVSPEESEPDTDVFQAHAAKINPTSSQVRAVLSAMHKLRSAKKGATLKRITVESGLITGTVQDVLARLLIEGKVIEHSGRGGYSTYTVNEG